MKLSNVKLNAKNPRKIKDASADSLLMSLLRFPRMLSLRPIVTDNAGTALGGNMRLTAIKRIVAFADDEFNAWIGNASASEESATVWQQVRQTKQIPNDWVLKAEDLTEDQQREFVIKDNVSGGDWDWEMLASDWDAPELEEWGLEAPIFEQEYSMDYSDKNKEINVDEYGDEMIIKLKYTEEEYNQVREGLAKIAQTPEAAVYKLLGYE